MWRSQSYTSKKDGMLTVLFFILIYELEDKML